MALALLIAFLVVPIVEIYVIVKVGGLLGVLPTVAILLAVSVVGAAVVRHEGRRAWQALNQAVAHGQMPGRELADGALVLTGGALLLTPGFVTDAVGLVLVLPPLRPFVRRALFALARRRARIIAARAERPQDGAPGPDRGQPVIRGEVIDDRDEHRRRG